MPWDDLQSSENYSAGAAYCYGKLANVLFARGLAKRLADDGIVAHAMHPGVVDSNFITHADERTQARYPHLRSRRRPQRAPTPSSGSPRRKSRGRAPGAISTNVNPGRPIRSLTMRLTSIDCGRRARSSSRRPESDACFARAALSLSELDMREHRSHIFVGSILRKAPWFL